MATRTFDIGDRPRFTATFKLAADDTVTDPSTVTFMWRTSAGVETSYVYGTDGEVSKSSTGVFVFTPPTIALTGPHTCRVKSTTVTTAGELAVGVRRTAFATP